MPSIAWLNLSHLVCGLVLLFSSILCPTYLEYPNVSVFALHPGEIKTQMAEESGIVFPDDYIFDTLQLPAVTMLYLTSGRLNWLSGKSVLCVLGHV